MSGSSGRKPAKRRPPSPHRVLRNQADARARRHVQTIMAIDVQVGKLAQRRRRAVSLFLGAAEEAGWNPHEVAGAIKENRS